MADENPDDEDDSELSEEDFEEFYDRVQEEMEQWTNFTGFNQYEFDPQESLSMSREDEISIKLYKAGSAIREFVQYLDEHDEFDPTDDRIEYDMSHLSGDQRALMHAFASFGQDLNELSDRLDDDDDENPFRVK